MACSKIGFLYQQKRLTLNITTQVNEWLSNLMIKTWDIVAISVWS